MSHDDWRLMSRVRELIAGKDPADAIAILSRECKEKPHVQYRLQRSLQENLSQKIRGLEGFCRGIAQQLSARYEFETGQVLVDRYEVVGRLGLGGFGQVYLVEDIAFDRRRLALKIMYSNGVSEKKNHAQFVREAHILARLPHPNIVPVHEIGELSDGRKYYTMKVIERGTLTENLRELNRMGGEDRERKVFELLGVVRTICSALQCAHLNQIVHCDVTPDNVGMDSYRVIQLLDWGIARVLTNTGAAWPPEVLRPRATAESTSLVFGKPEYMAPEQVRGIVDSRVDVFAVGAILCEILLGHTPYLTKGEAHVNDSVLLSRIAGEELQPILEELNTSPYQKDQPLLVELVCRALAPDPANRFANAGEMGEALEKYFLDREAQAQEKLILEKNREEMQRRIQADRRAKRRLAAAIGFLLLGTMISLLLWIKAQQNEREARKQAVHLARRQGLSLCTQSDTERGLLFLIRALELAEPRETELAGAIRREIDAWKSNLHSLHMVLDCQSPLQAMAFSPDGRRLFTALNDDTFWIWDLEQFTREPVTLTTTRLGLTAAFSPEGDFLVLGAEEQAEIWDCKTKKSVHVLEHEQVHTVAFHPRGNLVLTANRGGIAHLWNSRTGKSQGIIRRGNAITGGVFDPSGTKLVIATSTGELSCWDLQHQTPKLVCQIQGHAGAAYVAAAASKSWFVSAGHDGLIQKWNWDSPALWIERITTVHEIAGLHLHANGRSLVVWSKEGVQVWDFACKFTLGQRLRHPGQPVVAQFHPQQPMLATAGSEGTLRLWTLSAPISAHPLMPGSKLLAAGFSDDGCQLWTHEIPDKHPQVGGLEELFQIWDPNSRQSLHRIVISDVIYSPAIRPHEAALAVSSGQGEITLQSFSRGPTPPLASPKVFSPARTIAFTQDGEQMACFFERNGEGLLYSFKSEAMRRIAPSQTAIRTARFSPDNRWLAIGEDVGGEGRLRWWDIATWKEGEEKQPQKILHLAFSPNGDFLASYLLDGTVRVWRWPSRKREFELQFAQDDEKEQSFTPGAGLRFNQQGDLLLAFAGRQAQLWQIANGWPLGPPYRHTAKLLTAAFSPDGEILHTLSEDGKFWSWPVPKPEMKSPANLRDWMKCNSGLELDQAGNIQYLPHASLGVERKWLKFQTKIPNQ